VLLALHVAAILFYLLFKKRNLVKPMVVGSKEPISTHPCRPMQRAHGRWRR
jgi:cytochrome b